MKPIVLIALLAMVVVFTRCHRCDNKKNNTYNLTAKYKLNYKKGDILIFKSSENKLDTFKIRYVTSTPTYDNISHGGDCKDYFDKYEYCTYGIDKTSNPPNSAGSFMIRANSQRDDFNILWSNSSPVLENDFWLSSNLSEFTVTGKVYKNIYCFKNKYDTISNPENIILLYVSVPIGLIYYQQKNGIEWGLVTNK